MTRQDMWRTWLMTDRYGGDDFQKAQITYELLKLREDILGFAKLTPGEILLDVGTGDGFVAFGALAKTDLGKVIFADISEDLLDVCKAYASNLGALSRCEFIIARAEDLSQIPDRSVDVVTARSVLMYIRHRELAFSEFSRVLKPGGRLVVHEPRTGLFGWPPPAGPCWPVGRNPGPVAEIAAKVFAVYDDVIHNHPELIDMDEHTMCEQLLAAGFGDVFMHLQISVAPFRPSKWEVALRTSPNPLSPTLEKAMNSALTPLEREMYAEHMKQEVESARGIDRQAVVMIHARKSQDGGLTSGR